VKLIGPGGGPQLVDAKTPHDRIHVEGRGNAQNRLLATTKIEDAGPKGAHRDQEWLEVPHDKRLRKKQRPDCAVRLKFPPLAIISIACSCPGIRGVRRTAENLRWRYVGVAEQGVPNTDQP